MFTRNRTESENQRKPDTSADLSIPVRPMRPSAEPTLPPSSARSPVLAPRGTPDPRSSDAGRAAEPARSSPEARPRGTEAGARTLIVGREIRLSGNITACDQLVVEGSVEANLSDCQKVELAEDGLFKGSATIDEAEICGRFEGNLVVRKRLLIKSTGRVAGTIRYGQIEIECGGQISGDVQAQSGSEGGISPHPRIASAAE